MQRSEPAPLGRYTLGARGYDVLSLEWPVYRVGRACGVHALRLQPGQAVLDVGCGTGLSLPMLAAAVGATGQVVGMDASPQMLTQAARRVQRQRLAAVHLLRVAGADSDGWRPRLPLTVDAAIFCYSLSVMADWHVAWREVVTAVRTGGRIAVVDLVLPEARWRWLAPAARLLCWSGGVQRARRVSDTVASDLLDVRQWRLRGGHIVVTAGTVPAS